MTTPEHTIEALCQRSRDISLEKGWLNPDGTDPRKPSTVLLLFVSEISEALEEYRANKPLAEVYYEVKIKEEDGSTSKTLTTPAELVDLKKLDGKFGRGRNFLDAKPCGIPIEVADLVIRICQRIGSEGYGALLQETFNDHTGTTLESADFDDLMGETTCALTNWYKEAISPSVNADLEHTQAIKLDHLGYALALMFYFADYAGFDLWAAIDEKEAFNRTRSIRHGGKKC